MSKNEFERVSEEVVLIDGRHYRLMSDKETAAFIWSKESGLTPRAADECWAVRKNHMFCPFCGVSTSTHR